MTIEKTIAAAILLTVAGTLFGTELSDYGFNGTPAGGNWHPLILGDRAGTVAPLSDPTQAEGSTLYPVFIHTPNDGSWSYLVCDLPAGTLPAGTRTLQMSCDVSSARPDQLELCISEGVSYGGACTRLTTRRIRTDGFRTRVEFVVPLTSPENLISVAIGLNYHSGGGWALIDRIRLDASNQTVSAPEERETTLPRYDSVVLPRPVLDAIFPDAAAILGNQLARLDQAGYATSPLRTRRAALLEQLKQAYAGQLPPDRLPQLQQAIATDAWQVRAAGALEPVSETGALTDDNAARFDLAAPRSGRDAQLLLIDNASGKPQTWECRSVGIPDGILHWSRLQSVGGVPDCPVPESRPFLFQVPADRIGIWELEFSPTGLEPGEYTGKLVLTPLDNRLAVREVPLKLTVAETTLSETMPIAVFGCEYEWSATDPAFLALMLEMRLNTAMIVIRDRNDLSPVVKLADALRRGGMRNRIRQVMVEEEQIRHTGVGPAELAWLDRLTATMEANGFPYDQWFLHIVDETLGDAFTDAARKIKEHNPRIRIFSDALGLHPYRPDAMEVRKIAPYVDFWCPHLCAFTDRKAGFAEAVETARATGKPTWVYDCDSEPKFPFARAFIEPYVVFLNALDGSFYWTVAPSRLRPEGTQNYGMSYIMDGVPLPSRRWKLWRLALEDYLLLVAADRNDRDRTRTLAAAMITAYQDGTLAETAPKLRRQLLQLASKH